MDADDYNLKWNNFETGITRKMMEIKLNKKKNSTNPICKGCGSESYKGFRV